MPFYGTKKNMGSEWKTSVRGDFKIFVNDAGKRSCLAICCRAYMKETSLCCGRLRSQRMLVKTVDSTIMREDPE